MFNTTGYCSTLEEMAPIRSLIMALVSALVQVLDIVLVTANLVRDWRVLSPPEH